MYRMLKSSQDSIVAFPHYSDAKGLMSDFYVIAPIGFISSISILSQIHDFIRDFIAQCIKISDLSKEKQKRGIPGKTTSL
jgi:hypothetical protein